MRVRRLTNFLLGLVVLAIALVVVAQAFGVFPPAIYDLILRAWPALLVLIGLVFLLRGRIPFGAAIALIVSVALAVGVAVYAFSSRAGQQRDDNRQTITQPISADTALLRVRITTLDADVELLRALAPGAGVNGEFAGSTESQIRVEFERAADTSATLTISETRPGPLPMLEALGRGRLRLELPSDIPLDVEFVGTSGAVALNMSGAMLERLNADLARGDAVITLPDYDPAFSADEDTLGTFRVSDGGITVVVPTTLAARLQLDRGSSGIEPEYDPAVYNYLFNTVLEARFIETANYIVQYNVVAPRGRIRLEVSDAAAPPDAAATAEAA